MLGRQTKRGTTPTGQSEIFDWSWDQRRDAYSEWEAMYANSVYDDQADGGFRQIILSDVLKVDDTDRPLHGFYSPFSCIVDAYQNVFRGQFGREIRVSSTVGSAAEGQEERKVNQRILDPLWSMWRWSNLNDQKESLQLWCSNLGMVGLRIEAPVNDSQGRPIPPNLRRIRIRPVHPKEIVDFNEDADGNATDVLLEYRVLGGGLGEDRDNDDTVIRETLTKDRFIREVDDGDPTSTPNELGVCPFVPLRHKDIGAQFGIPAHYGSAVILHNLNWLLTRISISVDRHVFAKWFAAASGSAPVNFPLGDTDVAYVQMGAGDTAPKLEAIVAKLDFLGLERVMTFLIAHLRQRQPELVLSALEAMSGQSGETIAKLLVPVEEKIMISRSHYEHALVRAAQIGLSWGVLNSVWDIGTGMGTREAADAAYQQGLEDFQFNQRSALPETVFDKINRAKADVAPQAERLQVARLADGIFPTREKLRVAGVLESRIASMMKELAGEETTEDTEL